MTRETVAVIPARGGSKRVPMKNIVDFRGKPLVRWTIEAALDSGAFDRVVVSTDDTRIKAVAEEAGADVPFLRRASTGDHATSSEATITTLVQLEEEAGERYRTVAQLLPTCPLRGSDAIGEAMTEFRRRRAPFQISCAPFGWQNPWWAATLGADGRPSPLFPKWSRSRGQDLSPLYVPTGAIWVAEVEALKRSGTFYGEGHRYQPMDWVSAIDIDTLEDLQLAEALFAVGRPRSRAVGAR